MSNRPEPQDTKTKHDRDLAAFERLPVKTKELMKLKEHHDKTTGHKKTAVTKQIEDAAASYDLK